MIIRGYMHSLTREINLSKDARELHSSIVFEDLEDAGAQFARLADYLKSRNAELVALELFGKLGYAEIAESFKRTMGACDCPLTHVLPLDELSEPELAGVRAISVVGVKPEFKTSQLGSKGVYYKVENDEYCRGLGIEIQTNSESLKDYTFANLEEMEELLKLYSMDFSDVVRTWFYNRNILEWYADFNEGRTSFFNSRKVFERLLPASTGIGSPNPAGVPIQSAFIALKGAAKHGEVFEIESPLQCGAPKYGSSFARAVEFDMPSYKRIMVSGSASIDFVGNTAHFGDIKKQVKLTMDVIAAILEARGLDFADTLSSVAYCMRPEYIEAFREWMEQNCKIPYVPSYSTVCRSDLMFEVELEACRNV